METQTESKPGQIYLDAFKKWGVPAQFMVAMEECCELGQAISKVHRSGFSKESIEHLAEEIADVRIVIDSLFTLIDGLEEQTDKQQVSTLIKFGKRVYD